MMTEAFVRQSPFKLFVASDAPLFFILLLEFGHTVF